MSGDNGHLLDRETLEHYRTALDSGRMHGPWTRATCAAVLRTLDAAQAKLAELEGDAADKVLLARLDAKCLRETITILAAHLPLFAADKQRVARAEQHQKLADDARALLDARIGDT